MAACLWHASKALQYNWPIAGLLRRAKGTLLLFAGNTDSDETALSNALRQNVVTAWLLKRAEGTSLRPSVKTKFNGISRERLIEWVNADMGLERGAA